MPLFLKKKADETPKQEDTQASTETTLSEFLPYYCHYDGSTVLTKNGELIQIIKIASNTRGLDYESGDQQDGMHDDSSVRETIRKAIFEVVDTDSVALWIHTIRKRKSIRYRSSMKETFAEYTHQQWQQKHRWKYQYYNEIYVSVIYEGQGADLFNKITLKRVLLPKRNRSFRNEYLENAHEALNQTVSLMLEKIRPFYNAHRLSVVERISNAPETLNQPVCYSEPMEFLGMLLNLRTEPFPVREADLSSLLTTNTLTFGFNALETKDPTNKRRFGALMTLKQYREVPPDTADRLMQAPMEFIISQSFHFIPQQKALRQYREQKHYFDTSGDEYAIKASGLEEMLLADRKQRTDFGNHQTSIMVLSDDFKHLDAEVSKVQEAFSKLGLVTIREDIRLEECFWAQMPGNFEFLRRKDPIATSRVGGLCRLNRYPNGTDKNNHWGDAVTLVPTTVNSPYFFNFHHGDNGHTAVFNFNSFHDHAAPIMLNFLLTEARKFEGRIFMFDHKEMSKLYFNKLGGRYYKFPPLPNKKAVTRLPLNPFTLEDMPRNKAFLQAWCCSLIAPDLAVDESRKETLRVAIEQLYALPQEERHLPGLVAILKTIDAPLAAEFAPWHSGGPYCGLIDAATDEFDLNHPLQAFDMTPVIKSEDCIIPIFAYLLHRIIAALDGTPTIIVLYEAWKLLENPFFAPRLESLMEMLKQNNVMLIMVTDTPLDVVGTSTFKTVMEQCGTFLYIPDDLTLNYADMNLGLTQKDSAMLRRMDRQYGDVLLKQSQESIGLSIDLTSLDDIHAIFANDIKTLIAAGGKFASVPQEE